MSNESLHVNSLYGKPRLSSSRQVPNAPPIVIHRKYLLRIPNVRQQVTIHHQQIRALAHSNRAASAAALINPKTTKPGSNLTGITSKDTTR
jgi:hypothetical protein